MKTRRTLFFSLLVFVLGMSLLMLGSPGKANADGTLTDTEWKNLAGFIDSYIQSQVYTTDTDPDDGDGADGLTDDGEYGFMHTAEKYKTQVDNDGGLPGDGTICGVGDDMADRPVLVDNLMGSNTMIPGTSIRNQWNSNLTTTGGMSDAVLTATRNKVIAHREAGFSTDISIY